MSEEALLTGVLESTNELCAVAKIAGITLCESYNMQHGVDYRSVIPPIYMAKMIISIRKIAM